MSIESIVITSGPSREELFDGLRLFSEKRYVEFKLKHREETITISSIIQGIEPEDGSGQSWIIKFNVEKKYFNYIVWPAKLKLLLNKDFLTIQAYYSTKNRRGSLLLE